MRRRDVARLQRLAQPAAPVGRVAEAEPGDGLVGIAAAAQIVERRPAARLRQLVFEPLAGLFHHLLQARPVLRARALFGAFARHRQAGHAGQLFHRLGKAQPLGLHDEADDVAMGAAAEAVIELLVLADRERGGLFVVERAAGLVVLAALLEGHVLVHHVHDVDAGQQIVDELTGDAPGHILLHPASGQSNPKPPDPIQTGSDPV